MSFLEGAGPPAPFFNNLLAREPVTALPVCLADASDVVGTTREHEQCIAQPIQIWQYAVADLLRAGKPHTTTFRAPTDGAGEMQCAGGAQPAGRTNSCSGPRVAFNSSINFSSAATCFRPICGVLFRKSFRNVASSAPESVNRFECRPAPHQVLRPAALYRHGCPCRAPAPSRLPNSTRPRSRTPKAAPHPCSGARPPTSPVSPCRRLRIDFRQPRHVVSIFGISPESDR